MTGIDDQQIYLQFIRGISPDNQLEIRHIGINRPVLELLTELEEIERYKTEQLSGAYLYSGPVSSNKSHRKDNYSSNLGPKKKKSSKHANAHIISDESSSDSSDSENSMISSKNELETNILARLWNESESDSSETSSESSSSESDSEKYEQTNIPPQTAPEGSQSEAEILWPNPIEINFIRKIIPNDVTTIYCKISSPLGKIVQVPSAMIDSGANCLVISKGLIKLLEAEVDKNKKPSVKWRNNSLESSGISYNISVMVGQEENSCTISEDFLVMDNDKP
ncbi:hypothetical protein F8M41_009153 [Gigaspora margarita]|uniref:Uncharacterized protein n=1 Tax=Gigaspora margarita TaxID=4874 RepID=A0A8H4A366_GIGMA|nr:hypothetical protein F8M41_009153 [Gigaspora margarita]